MLVTITVTHSPVYWWAGTVACLLYNARYDHCNSLTCILMSWDCSVTTSQCSLWSLQLTHLYTIELWLKRAYFTCWRWFTLQLIVIFTKLSLHSFHFILPDNTVTWTPWSICDNAQVQQRLLHVLILPLHITHLSCTQTHKLAPLSKLASHKSM